MGPYRYRSTQPLLTVARQMSAFIVIAYDIADAKRRQLVAELCEERSHRVQLSLFEGWMTRAESRQVMFDLTRCIDPKWDQIRMYPLDLRDPIRRRTIGPISSAPKRESFYII